MRTSKLKAEPIPSLDRLDLRDHAKRVEQNKNALATMWHHYPNGMPSWTEYSEKIPVTRYHSKPPRSAPHMELPREPQRLKTMDEMIAENTRGRDAAQNFSRY
jgi:hypothetical protein